MVGVVVGVGVYSELLSCTILIYVVHVSPNHSISSSTILHAHALTPTTDGAVNRKVNVVVSPGSALNGKAHLPVPHIPLSCGSWEPSI